MQPKGVIPYFWDGNAFVPSESVDQGGTGQLKVTLFSTDGVVNAYFSNDGDNIAESATINLLGTAPFPRVFDGTNWDRVRSLVDNADNVAVGTLGLAGSVARLTLFDGTNWDRARSLVDSSDNIATGTVGLTGAVARLTLFDGTNWDRARSLVDNADDVATGTIGLVGNVARLTAFDGTNFDRLRSASAANQSAATKTAPLQTTIPGTWGVVHTPASDVQATITRAAGAAGVRHVCTSISAVLLAPEAVTSIVVQLNLRDGASGVGTILKSWTMQVGGAASIAVDRQQVDISGLQLFGSEATDMTLEFSAAGGAGTLESVSLEGYDIS